MTLAATMATLEGLGSEATRRVLRRHGATEPFFGVKIGDMKPLQKKLRGRQDLALQLFATGNGDAQYLAGLIADGRRMSADEVQRWADTASWSMISSHPVVWVAAEHPEGLALARRWIDGPRESVQCSGWGTLSALAITVPDEQLPVAEFGALLDRVGATLSAVPDGVRYAMNNFIIACGTYLAPLGDHAIATARKVGRVEVDMGETECKVQDAESYILKSWRGAPIAPKRKTVRC